MNFEVKNGYFSYKKSKKILTDICFSINSGEILAILGPNGVGKTTLLRSMMGLLKWDSGNSYLDNKKLEDLDSKEIWKNIAYVPQAKGVAFGYNVEEFVLLGRSSHIGITKQPSKKDKEFAINAMEKVGISHLKDSFCNQISGGELQMALIARALCAEPTMLILDEPESNLDFKNQLIILETIEKLSKNQGISCIFNTHYPAHALKISDYSLILSKDGDSFFGETNKLINNEMMRDVFDVNVDIHEVSHKEGNYKTVTALSIV